MCNFNVLYSYLTPFLHPPSPIWCLVHLSSSICNRVIPYSFLSTLAKSQFFFLYTKEIILGSSTRNKSKFSTVMLLRRFHIALPVYLLYFQVSESVVIEAASTVDNWMKFETVHHRPVFDPSRESNSLLL